jgi:MFS family permease
MKYQPFLWRDVGKYRSFVLYWLGRAISLLGTAITSVVLPIVVYRLTASAFLTSLLATFEVLPYLCFGLFAGVLADRTDRRRLMVGCDLLNTLLLGSIPLAAIFNVLTIPHIFLVAFLSAAYVWFDAANFGALPTLVGRERIVTATSAVWSMSTIVQIIGPAVGGVLAATIGPAQVISFDALSYVPSAASLLLIPRALSTLHLIDPSSHLSISNIFSGIGEGVIFIRRHRLVRVLTLLGFGISFTGGAVGGLLVVYAVWALDLPANDARIGLLFTAGAIGSLLASLMLPQVTRRFPVGWITLGAMMLNLLFLLGLVLASSLLAVSLILYALWELCYTLTTTNGIALRQVVTPDHLQSRVNAYARMIAWGGTPFGAAVGGLLAQWTTIRTTYLVMAVGVALSIVLGWFSPLREQKMVSELAEAN